MLSNLFKIPALGRILQSPWSWRLVRIALLVLLLLMIAAGWHHHAIPGVEAADPLMYTNLVNHGFWVWWMMGVVFLALLLGRAWCAACPVGWLNGLVARWGLRRALPEKLRSWVPVTVVLIVLQLAVYLWSIHRYPDYTARLLALMLLLAVGAGLLFRGRSFCTLFCPAGAVFGLYGRYSPMRLAIADPQICSGCEDQGCVTSGETVRRYALGSAVLFWRHERPSCPESLRSDQIGENPHCTLCLGCVSGCPSDNVALGTVSAPAGGGNRQLQSTEVLFFIVLFGMLTANFSKVNVDLRDILLWLPENLARLLGWQEAGFYLLATPWITLGLPLLLLLPGYLIVRLSQVKVDDVEAVPGTLNEAPGADQWRFAAIAGRIAFTLIPLLLSVHVILALVKINAKGPYLPLTVADPSGVKSYLAINVMQTMSQPQVWLSLDVIKWAALAILVAGVLGSLRAARPSRQPSGGRALTAGSWFSVALAAGLYGATLARWLFIR